MTRLAPADLARRIAAGERPVILDVRSEAEFAAGHVPGAVNVPFWRFLLSKAPLPPSNEPIVIYCGHGPRAHLAVAAATVRGLGPFVELDGHWAGWQGEGRHIERMGQ